MEANDLKIGDLCYIGDDTNIIYKCIDIQYEYGNKFIYLTFFNGNVEELVILSPHDKVKLKDETKRNKHFIKNEIKRIQNIIDDNDYGKFKKIAKKYIKKLNNLYKELDNL